MAASSPQSSQTPDFPFWPFNCLSLYAQMARDFGRYTEAVTHSTDAMETVRAEADFGVRLYADLMRGYYDLVMSPWAAMASAMADQARAASPPTPVAETLQARRSRGSR